jgi:ABC-2 type transport system permease protein
MISMFNPMFYMINAFRYSYTGRGDVPLELSLGIITGLTVCAFGLALYLFSIGFKLRN